MSDTDRRHQASRSIKTISEAIVVTAKGNLLIIEDIEDHSFVIVNKKELGAIVSFAKGIFK